MLTIRRTHSQDKDFQRLLEDLDIDLRNRYGPLEALFDRHHEIAGLETVIVIYLNDAPVGCGCFKPYDAQRAELKRMYVVPEHRSAGIASQILKELEQWAVEKGMVDMMLETGKQQPEAVGMYRKNGYEVIPNYGPYQGATYSLCMMKRLL